MSIRLEMDPVDGSVLSREWVIYVCEPVVMVRVNTCDNVKRKASYKA